MEPYRLRQWRVQNGQLFTCGRPGRSKGRDAVKVPERWINDWVTNLPGDSPTIVSLLGSKPDGTSEFSFYPFHGGFDDSKVQRGRPSFQEWLDKNHSERRVSVREHPTQDFRTIPSELLASIASEIRQLLDAGKVVVLIDSGGQQRTGAACRYMGLVEDFR